MKSYLYVLFGLIAVVAFPLYASGTEVLPFQTQNQSPVVQIFGLPAIEDAAVLSSGKKEIRFVIDHANNYVDVASGAERLILDGEISRFSLRGKYGLGRGFEVGIEVPYLVAGGGFLDGFIESYHNAFGFPNAGRDRAPKNRLLYRYRKNGADLLNLDSSSSGCGDLKFMAGYQLFKREGDRPAAVALRTALKVPTGNSDRLHGSGSTDASFWLTADRVFKFDSGDWTVFGAAGVMGTTDGNILADQRRNEIGFGAIGVGWAPWPRVDLKVQVNGHTAFYKDSRLDELGGASAQLTAGGTIRFSKTISLDIGLTEDIVVRTAPDVVFHFALRSTF